MLIITIAGVSMIVYILSKNDVIFGVLMQQSGNIVMIPVILKL